MLTRVMSIVMCLTLLCSMTPARAGDVASEMAPAPGVTVPLTGIDATSAPPPADEDAGKQLKQLLALNRVAPRQMVLSATSALPKYRFDATGQTSDSSQSSGVGGITTAGRVLFWVDIGLMGSGGAELSYAQTLKDKSYCTGSGYSSYCYSEDWSQTRLVWRASGLGSIATGAVLTIVGLTRRQ